MSVLIVPLVLTRVPDGSASPAGVRMLERMRQTLVYIDRELADVPYFAGNEFTAADVMMTFPFTTMRLFLDYDLAPYPNILAFLARIEARPAYRKAMAVAGPKSAA
jgi:glutathione S-transferase